ncbi:MAG: hypothetical protein AB7V25_16865 [Mangrovibacterium sp.]
MNAQYLGIGAIALLAGTFIGWTNILITAAVVGVFWLYYKIDSKKDTKPINPQRVHGGCGEWDSDGCYYDDDSD